MGDRNRRAWWLGLALALAGSGCTDPDSEATEQSGRAPSRVRPLTAPLDVARVPAPLRAGHCDVNVEGTGVIDLETEYLPNVVRCENGGANLEALKAQAIAARSVAYYAVETDGQICDSQGCQVFSCGGAAEAIHHQAVEETSGIYLANNATLTYGFYVAGDTNTAPPGCVGVSGATEQWVTYNEGQSGTSVEQTALGFVFAPTDNGYGQNRGCMSQWGARCLENNNGYDYVDILKFYYGEDIQLVQATAECIMPVDPTDGTSGSTSSGGTAGETGPGSDADPSVDPSTDPSTDPSAGSEVGPSSVTDSAGDATSDGGTGSVEGSAGDESPVSGPETAGGTGMATNAGILPENYGDTRGDGCGCRASPPSSTSMVWLMLVLLRRRRKRRSSAPRAL